MYERFNNVHHGFVTALKNAHRLFMSLSKTRSTIYENYKNMHFPLYERFNNVHHGFTKALKMRIALL